MSYSCDDFLLAQLRGGAPGEDELRHRASCTSCAALAPALSDVARTLEAADDVAPAPDLAGRVLLAASPLLAANARAARDGTRVRSRGGSTAAGWRARCCPRCCCSPLLVLADLVLLRILHGALATLLPQAISTYLVASYAVLLAALVCLTFGAIPLLVQRQGAMSWKEGHV